MTKYIFVTGGVVSSLGKGLTASAMGRLLKSRGLKVVNQKFDPYINTEPGMLTPYQHGEVFVTDDGTEADLDLGHYERFVDINVSRNSSVTTGRVFWEVISRERRGEYDGGTVQIIPHITNEIKASILRGVDEDVDVVITEIGGTVGDIESVACLEAVRQMKNDLGRENTLYVHLTLVPFLSAAGEGKTKPTQHSVNELRRTGIQPDIIICRADRPLPQELLDKISLFCDIEPEAVIQAVDSESVYDVPLALQEQHLDEIIVKKLGLQAQESDMREWQDFCYRSKHLSRPLKIAMVGKYVEMKDAYLSISEALFHACVREDALLDLEWINSGDVTRENVAEYLGDADGILVPPGFGARATEGKIAAIEYARTQKIPFFGIAMGMQLTAVEFARNVAGWKDATSREYDPETAYPVLDLSRDRDGAAINRMRLGLYTVDLAEGSKVRAAYDGAAKVAERHRNRYEYNPAYQAELEALGLQVTGREEKEKYAEVLEIQDHPWFVACLYHPEFKSRPNRPHPLFLSFVEAALAKREGK